MLNSVSSQKLDNLKLSSLLITIFTFCLVLSTILKQGEDKTSTLYYAASSLTYLLAMVCSNMALQWISYPTQVIEAAKIVFYNIYWYLPWSELGGWEILQAHPRYDFGCFIRK